MTLRPAIALWAAMTIAAGGPVPAQPGVPQSLGLLSAAAGPLITPFPARGAAAGYGRSGSLFSDRAEGSLFAPRALIAPQPPSAAPDFVPGGDAEQLRRMRALIGQAEAGRAGYDAVQLGARIRPPKPPTQMTVREIFEWIEVTPGQPHAIGLYQFIPKTLARLVRALDVEAGAQFTPDLQDRLADRLFIEAGYAGFRAGLIDRTAFMHNLAKIWAGFPTASGKSYYHGFAGNKATISRAAFEAAMAEIFPR